MNEVLTLVKQAYDYTTKPHTVTETTREVYCSLRSIGQREFYQAKASDVYPEMKFILADYLDYDGEMLVEYEGKRYRVLRDYRSGQELELTVVRATAEEGGVYG